MKPAGLKAMIFAAGMGTRLMPLTSTTPKALIDVNGKPLLQLIIEKLTRCGFSDIIINIHHFSQQIIHFCNNYQNPGCTLTLSDETGQLLDTGGGLFKAAWFFNDRRPFLVHNVDILSEIDLTALYKFHQKTSALATLAIHQKNSSRVLLFDHKKVLCGWANLDKNIIRLKNKTIDEVKPWGFSGIHVINPDIFKHSDKKGVFSIIDTYMELCKNHIINGFDHTNAFWIDVGSIENIEKARRLYLEKK